MGVSQKGALRGIKGHKGALRGLICFGLCFFAAMAQDFFYSKALRGKQFTIAFKNNDTQNPREVWFGSYLLGTPPSSAPSQGSGACVEVGAIGSLTLNGSNVIDNNTYMHHLLSKFILILGDVQLDGIDNLEKNQISYVAVFPGGHLQDNSIVVPPPSQYGRNSFRLEDSRLLFGVFLGFKLFLKAAPSGGESSVLMTVWIKDVYMGQEGVRYPDPIANRQMGLVFKPLPSGNGTLPPPSSSPSNGVSQVLGDFSSTA